MRGAIGGIFIVVALGWLVWVVSPESPCERARRGATPVGAIGDVVRKGLEHWQDSTDRLEMVVFTMQAEAWTRRFLAKQFYGSSLDCSKDGR